MGLPTFSASALGRRANKGSISGSDAKFLQSLTGDKIQTEEWHRSLFVRLYRTKRIAGGITPSCLALRKDQVIRVASPARWLRLSGNRPLQRRQEKT